MKALFLIFHGFDKANGISKKIHYQVKALKECGVDARLCYYDITPHCAAVQMSLFWDLCFGTVA